MNARQRWLALALIATLAAVFWPMDEDSEKVVESTRLTEALVRPTVATGAATSRLLAPASRERLAAMQSDLFPTQTRVPPPPKPKPYVAPPPSPPKPPPLPFKYMGRWVDAGQETLFLMQGEQPVPVQPGQVLAGSWRVDEITERSIVFTYLPLNMQSILGFTP